MRVCERVFSVGFGPGLDSMSPARSRRSASHVAGTHGWLPQKYWVAGPPERRGSCIQFAQSPRLRHTNHEQAVSVWCNLGAILHPINHPELLFDIFSHNYNCCSVL